jgi:hypothetical protein
MSAESLKSEMERRGIRFPSDDWRKFHRDHPTWVGNHVDDDGVLYCLPPQHHTQAASLFKLDKESERAEAEFCILCRRHSAIGFCQEWPIKYEWLVPLPSLPTDNLDDFLKLGWSQEDVDYLRGNPDPTADIRRRTQAAIGRLISRPAFHRDLQSLREVCRSLPEVERPSFPIQQTCQLRPQLPEGYDWTAAPDHVKKFYEQFDAFCDYWNLTGMATWSLPVPRGPWWTPELAPIAMRKRGGGYVETPWHYPAQARDGLGPLLMDEHRRQAAEHEVDDWESWGKYAEFLPLEHWDRVLRNRYPKEAMVHAFSTHLDALLSEIVGLSVDRVGKLHGWQAALRSGRLKSLKGLR